MSSLVQVSISGLGSSGEGVGTLDGLKVFVAGALPGEEIEARLIEKKKHYAVGKLVRLLQAAPHRRAPLCPAFGKCGGCQLMHLSYEQQLIAKRQRVVDALLRIGQLPETEVRPCYPSPEEFHYRNKIQMPLRTEANSLETCLYAPNSHDFVPITECHIHSPLGEQILRAVRPLLKKSGLSAYEESTGRGVLRHLLIRTAVNTKQALVILVTTRNAPNMGALAERILQCDKAVVGVVQNINGKTTNAILGLEWRTLAGDTYLTEQLLGLKLRISPSSFLQVNPFQAERLYQEALALANLTANDCVLDLYCGIGALSLLVAKKARSVVGIEIIADAAKNAAFNARTNSVSNCSFIAGPCEEKLATLAHIDVAFCNPPRAGCHPSVIDALADKRTKRIVYISCDPATLARDLKLFKERGYTVPVVQPVDMFPQTAHVESIACLHLVK